MIIKRRFLLPILLCWPFVSMGVDISTIQSAQTIDAALFHAEVALGKLNLTEEQKSEIKQKLQDIATVAKQPPEPANPEPEEAVAQEPDPDQCPPTYDKNGKQLNRLKSINENTRVGDFCSSSYIAVGKVKWYSKLVNGQKVCTCLASVCTDGNHVEKGRCVEDVAELATCPRQEYKSVSDVKTDEDALSFCETKGGKQCKTIGALKDYNGVKGLIICNPTKEESGIADQRAEDQKLHYYNCGDTRQIPSGISCSYVSDFSGYKITPLEADGLMKEYALKKYKDDIKCDEKSHRIQNDGNNYRQCASRKNDKQFYEFKFKDLDAGNKDFFAAVCKIWGLDYGKSNDGTYYVCKKASVAQCEEISAAMKRTFFPGSGEAVPETTKKGSTNCIIKQHEAAIGSRYQINSKATTIDQFKTTDGTDVMHFYDKNIQVNANKSLYTDIQTYLFNELNLPVKPMQCSSGFVDNVMVIPMTTQEYEATRKKQNECASQSNRAMAGSMWGGGGAGAHDCMKKYPIPEQMSDVLPCEYNGKRFDLAFKKLDVKWDKKSTGGYQGVRCLTNGGTFTGKTCGLASKKQCDDFKADFEKQFPGSKGVEWDPDFGDNGGCVLKDAKHIEHVRQIAEVGGMVALTLVTAVAGGPIVWGLAVVEGAALVTEAQTEGKLSNWSDKFISDATQCSDNDSGCANAVLKKHIARIIKGSKYFDETQGKAIAKQTTRLMGMLSSDTYNQINDKVPDGINLQNDKERDTVLENAILGYYGTKLTSDEKALLTTKEVATVLTFATLIGGGVMAGLRQGVKRNLFKISKARQAKWLDLKILKPGDVADDVVAMSKTGQKAAATAGKTAPAAGKSWEEELAEIGVKEEKTANGAVRYKDTKTGKYISKDEVLQRIDNMPSGTAAPKPAEAGGKPKEPKPETKPAEPEAPKDSPVGNPVKSKSQKIADARKRGDLGYHGTDADIAMDDMIRPSSNTANLQGKVQYGYGIAKDYDAAERYAVRRVVERQNVGKDLDFVLDTKTNTLIITNNSTTPLNLSKKTGYVYTTAKDSDMAWEVLHNSYAAEYAKGFEAAQMPNAVEILDKKAFNIDDLVRQGKVKIVEPNVPKTTPKPTPTAAPKSTPKATPKSTGTKPTTTPKPAETKPVSTPAAPKRTPAQEEAQWRTLYEKYAPENQTFDNFKKSFGNNLDEAEEYAKNWDEMLSPKEAQTKVNKMIDDFSKKYDSEGSFMSSYYKYVEARREAEATAKGLGTEFKLPDLKTPQLKNWTQEQLDEAKQIYDATSDANVAHLAPKDDYYSTWDPNITKLRQELQGNSVSVYTKELNDYINKQNINLTREEADNIGAYIRGKNYDTRMLSGTFSKDSGLNTMTEQAKNKYQELLLTQKSKNVNKIDEVAGISKKNLLGQQVAKNEFVQNFVSKRVSMYEDIITKNPSIYNRAKRWKQLSIEDREKLCKEIFEIADTKLGVEHTDFAVKDLVKDFGKTEKTLGLQTGGNVYLSSRHFPNMSFSDVMDTIAHEQAHKVDHLNPNKGILGSQLADLGSKEGYIQGYAGRSYADYRKELTEQSSWLIGTEMKKAISKLGL